ncbi:MAG TPA: NUDIX domain-containing protein [Kofleriaceae bacterium]
MIYLGACHCGALGFAYETALAPSAWPIRACACGFCRSHGAATTSDPAGTLELTCRDAEQRVRYRFGLRTADFWLCRTCGVYLGAATADGRFGLVNTRALVDRSLALSPPQAMSYDGETAASRIERREQRWTPVRASGTPAVHGGHRTSVGVGVMVRKHGKVLLGRRKGSHGAGEYAWPGGHLEYGERFAECAAREVAEETGMQIGAIRFLRVLNTMHYAPTHYVDIALVAEWLDGEPEVREPDKVDGWAWYDLDALPSPLFHMVPTAIEALRGDRRLWDGP